MGPYRKRITILKLGDSIGITIPKPLAEMNDLFVGKEVDIIQTNKGFIIEDAVVQEVLPLSRSLKTNGFKSKKR